MEDLKEHVLQATIDVFKEKGIKFTMDDIAKKLSISKKTIYTVTKNKNTLINEMVKYSFERIKTSEQEVLQNDALTTIDKLMQLLSVLPEGYKDLDLASLYDLKEKYPQAYKEVEKGLETGWESTIALLEKGKEEGVIRDINIPIFKAMFEASLERFFKRDILKANHLSYSEGLECVLQILVEGIKK